ncbi:hypothetical protein VTN02DRAFT_6081 [Thermoascus thermophilus]
MPLDEEGAKWSCEPCVRGHRSSKCQHFDRLMMKVPKAGRPLAKCPHPKGSCSCQKLYAFMVRIPKGSTCLCRPLYKVPMSAAEASQSPAPAIAPASSAAGKVQKYSRRQSNLQAAPENIAKALNSLPEFSNQQAHSGMASPVPPPYMFQYPTGFENSSGTSTPNHGPTTTPSGQIPDAGASVEPHKGGCCSSKSEPAPQPQPQQQAKGSCCGGKPRADVAASSSQLKQEGHEAPAMPFNFAPYPAYPGYWPPSWQGGPPPPQNFTFEQSYPQNPYYTNGFQMPNFAPQPPPPMDFAPSNFQQNMNTVHAALPQFMPTDSNGYSYAPLPAFGGDSGHECNCGDDCQCLGCATHPFNDTTRQHIQQMGYMMALREEDENSEGSDGCRNTPVAGPMSPTAFNYPALAENNPPTERDNSQESVKGFSGQNATPSFDNAFTASTHPAGQPLMQPSQYYTVEYPVGLLNPCSDVTGTCQCGNDCSCDGCLTHSGHTATTSLQPGPPMALSFGDTLHAPLEKSPASANEATPAKTAEFTAPPGQPLVPGPAPIPTLEDLSFSPLSPPAIEPQAV